MLHWLAGQRPPDSGNDPKMILDPPETPAPVFAVRAFKHAIFGTPQTQEAKPRRYSNTESSRPRVTDTKPLRPSMTRPKSWNESRALGVKEDLNERSTELDPPPSPTKGILLTPGSAATRRKTVSFGDELIENEFKRPLRENILGDGDENPASRGAKQLMQYNDLDPHSRSRGLKKSNEEQQIRIESPKRREISEQPERPRGYAEFTNEFAEPLSDSGQYWKQEYDIYRESTTREVRKLVAKQKAAKAFARDKEQECSRLAEQLREEQQKAARLEKRTAELEAQLKEYQAALQKDKSENSPSDQTAGEQEPERLKRQDPPQDARPALLTAGLTCSREERQERLRQLRESRSKTVLDSSRQDKIAQGSTTQPQNEPEVTEKPTSVVYHEAETERNSVDPADGQAQPLSPPVADFDGPAEVLPRPATSARPSSPKAKREPPAEAKPLQPLSVNALAQDTRSLALSMGLQPPTTPLAPPRGKSPTRPVEPPRGKSPTRTVEPLRDDDAPSIRAPAQPHVADEPEWPPLWDLARDANNSENVKPSANPAGGAADAKRNATGRDGREVSAERLAAARARLLARGRQVS